MPDPRRDPMLHEAAPPPPGLLVVDDEDAFRHGLVRRLGNEGYACRQAVNALSARAVLEAHADEIDVVLCDIGMPGESGLDLLRSMTADHPGVALVMTTGITDPAAVDDLRVAEIGRASCRERV